jgi:hypothetical protein
VANNSAVTANTAKETNATHTGDVTGSGELTIANGAVSYAKMQNVASNNVFLGNNAGADSIVVELTASQVRSILNVADGAIANVSEDTTPQLGGDLDCQGHNINNAPIGQTTPSSGSFTKIKNAVRGSDTFNGSTGTTVDITAHAIGTADYMVVITFQGSSGFIGEVSVESKAANSFVVKNSGSDVTTGFDWEIIL